jgi:hypothetical protein
MRSYSLISMLGLALALNACSSGGGGLPNHSSGATPVKAASSRSAASAVSPALLAKINAPQVDNEPAIGYLRARAKMADATLPSVDLIFQDSAQDKKSQSFARLNSEGRNWLANMRDDCNLQRPVVRNSNSENHSPDTNSDNSATKKAVSGPDCEIAYSFVTSVSHKADHGKETFTDAIRSSNRIIDEGLRDSSGIKLIQLTFRGVTEKEAASGGSIVSKTKMPVEFKISTTDGVISGKIETESVFANGALEVAMLYSLSTPQGDLTLSFHVLNGNTEIKIGGRAATIADIKSVLGSYAALPIGLESN